MRRREFIPGFWLPPDEIAAAVFLAGDASNFMTSTDLLVDGGYNAI